jgi:hypothetical protein
LYGDRAYSRLSRFVCERSRARPVVIEFTISIKRLESAATNFGSQNGVVFSTTLVLNDLGGSGRPSLTKQ